MQQLRCDGSWKALCGTAKGKSRDAGDEKECATATCRDQRVAAWSLLNEGGDGRLRWVGGCRV